MFQKSIVTPAGGEGYNILFGIDIPLKRDKWHFKDGPPTVSSFGREDTILVLSTFCRMFALKVIERHQWPQRGRGGGGGNEKGNKGT